MATVLVTGGGERLDEVVSAAEAAGHEVVSVQTPDRLGEAVSGRTFEAYVQLPVAMTPGTGSLVSRIEQFLSQGLLSRFRAADAVLPSLAPGATVLLVSGQTNLDSEAPDDREARLALMRVLAHGLRAERAPERLTVRTADPAWTGDEIVRAVTVGAAGGEGRREPTDPTAEENIAKAYADWRTEVLGLMRVEF